MNQVLQFSETFPYMLVLARIMGVLITLPGFRSQFIHFRARIMLGVALTAAIAPILQNTLPIAPPEPYQFFSYLAFEVLVGVFLGTMGRLLLAAIDVAGSLMAAQASMLNAFATVPGENSQAPLFGSFLSLVTITLFFVADIHHIALQALMHSYEVFEPGVITAQSNMSADLLTSVVRILAEGFMLGLQIATPLIILGLLFFIGMGLLNRLMPQLHVFFVGQPMQIMMGIMVLALICAQACTMLLERLAYLYVSLWGG